MDNKRRTFLQAASLLTAGLMINPLSSCSSSSNVVSKNAAGMVGKPSLEKFGIQLYTVRDVIVDNPQKVIKDLSTFGFQQVEGYDGPQGMFWNMQPKDFQNYLGDLGMKMVSSHVDINKDFEKKAGQAAEIGMEYLICPHIGPQKSVDAWKKVTDKFNACGKICKDNGIKFAYHNHAYSFIPFAGMIPHDFLMENTDPDLVDHEMDIYWVVTGGADPIEYLKKYPNRFRLCHVKDRSKSAAADEHSASVNLGTGMIDFPKILKVAKENGMKYYIMEQEKYENSTSMKSAQVGAEYLKKLVFA